MSKNNLDVLSPELIKILKIFGIGSLIFVLVLSFFNEKRANNSGKESSPMHVADAERIFFKNVRAAYYDIENRKDAKMTVYRHGKLAGSDSNPSLIFSIILNPQIDEAYLFLESSLEEFPINLRWISPDKNLGGEITFEGGDKFAHFEFAKKIAPLLLENAQFEIFQSKSWLPIWENEQEKNALIETIEDYQRLVQE